MITQVGDLLCDPVKSVYSNELKLAWGEEKTVQMKTYKIPRTKWNAKTKNF